MKRRLVTIAILLLAGAVVNLAVAWGCALAISFGARAVVRVPAAPMHRSDARWWDRHRPSAITDELAGIWYQPTWGQTVKYYLGDDGGWFKPAQWELRIYRLRGSRVSVWDPRGPYKQGMACRFLSGLPTLSLEGEVWYLLERPIKTSAILRPRWARSRNAQRIFPLRPIWPGFAINTLFYAGILWVLILGPFALRRLIRRRRGLCPGCAYDLRHAEHEACPECGVTA